MKLILVSLIYASSITPNIASDISLVNRLTEQMGVRVSFIYKPIDKLPCLENDNVYSLLFCLKRNLRTLTLEARGMPSYPLVMLPELPIWATGSFSGRFCANIGRKKDNTFLTATSINPEVTSNIIAHEIGHALGAKHIPENPNELMYPFGGLHKVSEVYVGDLTKRQVRRCLTRLRYLGRHRG